MAAPALPGIFTFATFTQVLLYARATFWLIAQAFQIKVHAQLQLTTNEITIYAARPATQSG